MQHSRVLPRHIYVFSIYLGKKIWILRQLNKLLWILRKYVFKNKINFCLTLSWRRPILYRNQSIDLRSKSMDWFLYDIGLRHERDKKEKNVFVFYTIFNFYFITHIIYCLSTDVCVLFSYFFLCYIRFLETEHRNNLNPSQFIQLAKSLTTKWMKKEARSIRVCTLNM